MESARLGATIERASNVLEEGTLLDQLSAEVEAIAETTLPGVVHIEVSDSSSRFVFRRSNGAGWVYDDQGHIVTNAHVVGDAERVRVELYDGRVERARVIGRDIHTDIAVIKIDPGAGVFPLRRASGAPLRIGARVFAFGSPFGIKFSMSQGIVSGLGRSEAASFLNMVQGYTNFIQTDAAMNPGNSGGPLVDANARVVGMNAAIANNAPDLPPVQSDDDDDTPLTPEQRAMLSRPLGQSAGIGFAIPLETVESVVTQLISQPMPVLRGYLGIQLGPELPELRDMDPGRMRGGAEFQPFVNAARSYTGAGVIVSGTPENEPAAQSGLRPADIIVRVGDTRTDSVQVLRSIVSVQQPGTTVPVVVWRDGAMTTVEVTLGAAFNQNQGGMRYVPGSQNMTLEQIRQWITDNR
jgi:S1-C subfamily serine protease